MSSHHVVPHTITVRPFTPEDFERVVDLMPPEWSFTGCSATEARAQARMDFAGVLSCCNVRLVAESTALSATSGTAPLAGILFARLEALPAPEDASVWEGLWEEAHQELLAGSPHALLAARYEEQLGERGSLLVQAAGSAMGQDNELELFVANPTMRGCGAGSALMAAFDDILAAHHATSYWLQTDTTCTWEWYEHHGYVRAADVELSAHYPMPPEGSHLSLHAERHRVFMYRRDCPQDCTNASSLQ